MKIGKNILIGAGALAVSYMLFRSAKEKGKEVPVFDKFLK